MNDVLPGTGRSVMAASDDQLWMNFKNGDRDAFSSLYLKYYPFLVQSGLRISADKDLARDCAQDLFVEMWKNRVNLNMPKSFKAYLCISIQRKIIRQVKRMRLRKSLSSCIDYREGEGDQTIEMKIILDQLCAEQRKIIGRGLDLLTKRQREAVYLRFFVGLGYSEIAAKMGIGSDSIYNLVSKAIDIIQAELARANMQSQMVAPGQKCRPIRFISDIH